MIVIVDFGSQTAHLIERRIKRLGSAVKIVHPEEIMKETQKPHFTIPLRQDFEGREVSQGKGIILSGGPSSVYVKNAPTIDPVIFSLNVPILGICYGLQLMAKILGGKVVSGKKEYGPATLTLKSKYQNMKSLPCRQAGETNPNFQNSKPFEFRYSNLDILKDLPKSFVVWMSHGDEVLKLPQGFKSLGSTENVKNAFVANFKKKFFGVQFHPEVEHTEFGIQIIKNFVDECYKVKSQKSSIRHAQDDPEFIEGSKFKTITKSSKHNIKEIKRNIEKIVGDSYVMGAVSGGVDSTVAGILCADAIGDRFIPVYVDNGLMRDGTTEHVMSIFKSHRVRPIVVKAVGETLTKLKKITDPEEKRKIIGYLYVKSFEKEMKKLIKSGKNVKFLLQGTIYSDVIESGGMRRPNEQKDQSTKHAAKIKSHHNVGGLPKNMKLKLLEPLRNFYKDEVREIGKILGLPDKFVYKQPFPGPGYAVRIRGEVTAKKLEKIKKADKIVLEELEKEKLLERVFQSFPVLTGASSTAVKGDGRFFGDVIALRIVESKDIMTSNWAYLPYDVLQKISSRIVNEVDGVSRVVYDITTKPPATMEWE